MSRLRSALPETVRGFTVLSFASASLLLVSFAATRFIPFGFLALVAFVVGIYLTVHTVWTRFQRWLGWTRRDH